MCIFHFFLSSGPKFSLKMDNSRKGQILGKKWAIMRSVPLFPFSWKIDFLPTYYGHFCQIKKNHLWKFLWTCLREPRIIRLLWKLLKKFRGRFREGLFTVCYLELLVQQHSPAHMYTLCLNIQVFSRTPRTCSPTHTFFPLTEHFNDWCCVFTCMSQ